MAKTFNMRAPDALRLHEMSEHDIESYVKEKAEGVVNSLPEGVRIAGINAVAVDDIAARADGTEVWVQWSRACCGLARIEDFEPPLIDEVMSADENIDSRARGRHFESQLRSVTLEYPSNHPELRR